jgi:hypothetical protein
VPAHRATAEHADALEGPHQPNKDQDDSPDQFDKMHRIRRRGDLLVSTC